MLLSPCVGAQNSGVRLNAGARYDANGGNPGDSGVCHEGWAACGVWHHDQKAKGDYRLAAIDCYQSLNRALDREDDAFELNQRLPGTKRPEHGELVADFNQKIDARRVELEAHRQCITQWFADHKRSPPADLAGSRAPAPVTGAGDATGTSGGATWVQKLDQALGKIPYLHETDRFLAQISDYDMTKPHMGAKIMAESVANLLGEAGFSYLTKGVQTLLAKGASQVAEQTAAGAAVGGGKMEGLAGKVTQDATQTGEAVGATLGGRAGAGTAGSSGTGNTFGTPAGGGLAGHSPPSTSGGGLAAPGSGGNSLLEQHGPPPGSGTAPPGPARNTLLEQHGPPPGAGVGEFMHPESIWQAELPPGTEISPILRRTPRPVYTQQSTHSCVLSCSRMISETQLGHAMPEEWLAQIAQNAPNVGSAPYTPGAGTWHDRMQEVLWHAGVPSRYGSNVTVDELRAATANGAPAMVALGTSGGHAAIVDEIIDTSQGSWVVLRDPANLDLLSPQARANAIDAGFSNAPVMSLQDFMADFIVPGQRGGKALLTD